MRIIGLASASVTGTIFLILPSLANAALLGRLPATPGGMDYQAYYDTDLGITWLADANLAASKTFGTTGSWPGIQADGSMNWDTALSWISNMNFFEYLGANNWRLPATLENDATCSGSESGFPGLGYNCTGSEMGHLFYNELDALDHTRVSQTGNPRLLAKFTNIQDVDPDSYWSGTESTRHPGSAWSFNFYDGQQSDGSGKSNHFYVWAVRDGDIAAVPLPASVWLFSSGLMAFLGFNHKKRPE